MSNDRFDNECWSNLNEYTERLVKIAATRLGFQVRRRIDPEDVVHSVYRSIIERDERWILEKPEELWALLAYRTQCKAFKKLRDNLAQKRSISSEVSMSGLNQTDGHQFEPVELRTPPDELELQESATRIERAMREMFSRLSDTFREIMELFLQGYETKDISSRLRCAERTVRRAKERARDILEELLPHDLQCQSD